MEWFDLLTSGNKWPFGHENSMHQLFRIVISMHSILGR